MSAQTYKIRIQHTHSRPASNINDHRGALNVVGLAKCLCGYALWWCRPYHIHKCGGKCYMYGGFEYVCWRLTEMETKCVFYGSSRPGGMWKSTGVEIVCCFPFTKCTRIY